MSETITWQENLCGDFPIICDWTPEKVSALSSVVTALVVVVGLHIAAKQLTAWRIEKRSVRRSEVAEELIALAFKVHDAMQHMRMRIDSIPRDKANDRMFRWNKRYERVVSYNDLFNSLRDAQIRVKAVLGIEAVDQAVDSLISARSKIAIAIEVLAEMESQDVNVPRERNLELELRKDVFGHFSKDDELGQKILTALSTIENELSPIARLEASKR